MTKTVRKSRQRKGTIINRIKYMQLTGTISATWKNGGHCGRILKLIFTERTDMRLQRNTVLLKDRNRPFTNDPHGCGSDCNGEKGHSDRSWKYEQGNQKNQCPYHFQHGERGAPDGQDCFLEKEKKPLNRKKKKKYQHRKINRILLFHY